MFKLNVAIFCDVDHVACMWTCVSDEIITRIFRVRTHSAALVHCIPHHLLSATCFLQSAFPSCLLTAPWIHLSSETGPFYIPLASHIHLSSEISPFISLLLPTQTLLLKQGPLYSSRFPHTSVFWYRHFLFLWLPTYTCFLKPTLANSYPALPIGLSGEPGDAEQGNNQNRCNPFPLTL
jgi:hypothetical protein